MRDFALPSGAVLKIDDAPFADAKALEQAILAEFRRVKVSTSDMENVFKQFVCIGFSSPTIERCLRRCFEKCLYVPASGPDAGNPSKISDSIFEPRDRRVDWVPICTEVARENVGPFMTALYALYCQAVAAQKSDQESGSETTQGSTEKSS